MSTNAEGWMLATGLLAALIAAQEVGYRLARRAGHAEASGGSQVGAIQGAVLGLLGLLLAFSFAAAGARFLERQDLIVQEANAIGTAYLRAELLHEPERTVLRTALAEYTEHRVMAQRQQVTTWDPRMVAEVEAYHARMWSAARDGVIARPEVSMLVLPPVNEVLDLHSTRIAAARKHVPGLVMVLLLASCLLSMAVIGYGCGIDGRRRLPLTLSLAVLIGMALWITFDLDYPRRGLLRLDDSPLTALKFDAH